MGDGISFFLCFVDHADPDIPRSHATKRLGLLPVSSLLSLDQHVIPHLVDATKNLPLPPPPPHTSSSPSTFGSVPPPLPSPSPRPLRNLQLEQTPLHVASSCGNRGAVAVLLDLNADPEATDRKGRTPGQSFLRQVSKRARADIRASLEAAVQRRIEAAEAAAAAASFGDGSVAPPAFFMSALASSLSGSSNSSSTSSGAGATAWSVLSAMSASGDNSSLAAAAAAAAASTKVVMRRAGSTNSYEEAAPVKRPSMLSLLPAWGGNGRGAGGVSEKGGETSFRTAFAVL